MISLIVRGNLWEDFWISIQHFFNEFFLITICFTLIILSNAFNLSDRVIEHAGNFVIVLVVVFIVFNILILVYDALMFLRTHSKRKQFLITQRKTRKTVEQINRTC